MEQMMGVKEGLPDSIAGGLKDATWRARFRDGLRFLGSLAALAGNHLSVSKLIRRFYERLNKALGDKGPDLSQMRPDELVGYYRALESQLLTRWDAPLINDFLAMIFYGVLKKLTEKWCGEGADNLHNDLLCGEGGMISAEPAAQVREMARSVADDPAFRELLREGTLDAILKAMDERPQFAAQYHAYLEKFGDRCLEELKLESSTLHDNPLPLLRSVASSPLSPGGRGVGGEGEARREAELRVRTALRWRPLRRLIFAWVLKNARGRVRDRENLRFERTRLFGRVRRILLELGRRFHALDVLDQPRDVFYLEVNEVLGFVDGTATCTDLRGLVALRKAEFERFQQMDAPADRFETHGVVNHAQKYQSSAPAEEASGEQRQGLGCCPGVVRGPVRVIIDPRGARLQNGEILVAERTDPGWIMLFPAAAGLLVERGSLLSHSAIVAREMGIPAIVSIRGVTRWLKDGDWVELDGSKGVVIRVPAGEKVAAHGQ
jgi:pyruvate,water dikinase